MKKVMKLFVVLVASYFIFLLNGCSGKGTTGGDKKITIVFSFVGLPEEINIMQDLINSFEKENPAIEVRPLHISQGYNVKTLTMAAGGVAPDVMWMNHPYIAAYAEKGALMDLSGLLKEDKSFDLDGFYPTLVELASYKKGIYIIPKDIAPFVLFYNKTMFDKEGLAYPDNTWDWNSLLSAARRLTKDFNGDGRIDQFGYNSEFTSYYGIICWLHQAGGSIFNRDMTKCLLDSPASIRTVRFMYDISNKYHYSPTLSEGQTQGWWDMFMTGRLAMVINSRWVCPTFMTAKTLEWDIAVLPRDKQRATMVFCSGYAISKQSKHIQAAWKLVKYLAGEKAQTFYAETGLQVPSLKSIANSSAFINALPGKNSKAFLDMLDYGYPEFTHPRWSEITEKMGNALELIWLKKLTVEEGCKKMTKEIDDILKADLIR